MDLPPRTAAAPSLGDVLALIMAFGWEGLWLIWLGVRHGVWIECMAGLLLTALLWRHIGTALRDLGRSANAQAIAL
ncbi:hypothetical protein [Herbaspirillum sp. alder98]|uniref:hypothetical protein n=1 Tax=Herbaspirillum sp. alder98 TaxID=2913096 RepID=UPI001CD8A790|nr:hypothetical protein [Herbaspirillum sp. alder98]MCA1325001.1 hypothetical protein [Herbaspirillum sp. alder98]